jgi:hypothetical protein
LVGEGHDQVPRLLDDPGAVGVGGDSGEMDATACQVDEEEHVQPTQPTRLDREEVTLEDPGSLLAQELPPAGARSPRCGLDAVAVEDVPDAARRQWDAEPDQLAVDPLVSPTRILRSETEDQLSRLRDQPRPARVGPAAADELTMPAEKRRRLDEERPRGNS